MEDSKSLEKRVVELPPPALHQQELQQPRRFGKIVAILFVTSLWAFAYIHRYSAAPRSVGLSSSHLGFEDPTKRGRLSVKQAEDLFLSVPNNESATATSRKYATIPHLAGNKQDLETAKYFLEHLQTELGIPVPSEVPIFVAGSPESRHATLSISELTQPSAWIDEYYPVLNTPLERSLEILDSEGNAAWVADLEEQPDALDPASEYAHTIGAWHGLSAEGNVTGKLVYVDYGRKSDFDALVEKGVSLNGTVVLVRYGGVFRGLKVKAAQEAGAVGVLIYSDPRDFGSVIEENGYKPYPHGPALNPTSVQRGSVQFLSSYPGDPTTPGAPAYPNATRVEGGNIPSIPSIPLSWANAQALLAEFEHDDYRRLGARSNSTVRLVNKVKTAVTPIWNTIGVIPGHLKDEVVLLGNHRDAWVNGAADPTSGTASVHEIIRGLGALSKKGWKPLRTIVIASWDAEEYGLIGSTEWGEDFPEWIQDHVVAYFNIDVSVAGSHFAIGSSPSLAHLLRRAAQDVAHPTDASRTLWDARADQGPFTGNAGELGIDHFTTMQANDAMTLDPVSTGVHPLGSGSDYTVFLQRLGVASTDGGFGGSYTDAVYHYHSIFDSQRFQEVYADPGFHKHVAIAKYLGLSVLRAADSILIPINTTQYSLELGSYLNKVENIASKLDLDGSIDLSDLRKSIHKLQDSSVALDKRKQKAEKALIKALKRVGKKNSKHQCSKRRWNKVRTFVKRTFGVSPSSATSASANSAGVIAKRNVQDVRIGGAGADSFRRSEGEDEAKRSLALGKAYFGKAKAKAVPSTGSAADKRSNDDGTKRGLDISKVRLGKAAAGWTRDALPIEARNPDTGSAPDKRSIEPIIEAQVTTNRWDIGALYGLLPDIHAVASTALSPPDRRTRNLIKAAREVSAVNKRLATFERGFISEAGIKDREWYKHLGVAPGKWLGYGATTLPALTEAIELDKNSTLAKIESDRLESLINKLTHSIKHSCH